MKNLIQKFLVSVYGISIMAAGTAAILPSAPVVAQSPGQIICNSLNEARDNTDCDASANSKGLIQGTVKKIVNLLTFIVGVVSTIIIVVAGLMYALSGGNPQNTQRAKDAIIYAIIGVVISIAAYAIVNFVLTRVG